VVLTFKIISEQILAHD